MQNTSFLKKAVAVMLVTTFLLTPVITWAQSCDPDTEARLQFLETRLDDGQRNTLIWWGSWLTVFSVGAVYKTVQGATRSDGSDQAADFFTAGKSVIGVAQMLIRPNVGRHGAAPMRAIPKTSPQSCAERLRLAEKNMSMAADDAHMRWSWKRHLISLVLNLSVAVAIDEGFDDPGNAWRDFGVSEASAELHLWTHPTRAYHDWEDYRKEFDHTPVASATPALRLASLGRGIGFRWDF